MYQKNCEICGSPFEAVKITRRYCDKCQKNTSRAQEQIDDAVARSKYFMQDDYAPVMLTCHECGKQFPGPAKMINWSNLYCSGDCRRAAKKKAQAFTEVNTSSEEFGNTVGICLCCGKEFRYQRKLNDYVTNERKFCSPGCMKTYRSAESAKKKVVGDITLICKNCGKEFIVHKDKPIYPETLPKYCSKECRIEISRNASKSRAVVARREANAADKQAKINKEKKMDIKNNGLCAYCKTPYMDCERMQSNFRVIPKGAKFDMNGKIRECPKYHPIPD